jgi:molybdopterin-guanine dinucleotide biosynthesis protein A
MQPLLAAQSAKRMDVGSENQMEPLNAVWSAEYSEKLMEFWSENLKATMQPLLAAQSAGRMDVGSEN